MISLLYQVVSTIESNSSGYLSHLDTVEDGEIIWVAFLGSSQSFPTDSATHDIKQFSGLVKGCRPRT